VRTADPSADGFRSAASRTAIGGGISSRRPWGDKKGSSYSIAERMLQKLIPVLGSQPAGDASHKPGGRLLLLSARPAVALTTLKRAATSFAAW